MANEEHVEQFKRGVQAWNLWRREHPEIRPDLSNVDFIRLGPDFDNFTAVLHRSFMTLDEDVENLEAFSMDNPELAKFASRPNFSSADLSGADLNHANLRCVDLSGADLSHANLSYSDLSFTNLGLADLSFARILYARLDFTYLSGSNLSHTDLRFAGLSHAKLSLAKMNQTIFGYTILAWTDLSNVKGLETAKHEGPSIVHINSVILPHDGATRLHFLRGVGFTETQIEYLPSLLTPRPIEYCSLFISYTHQDEAIAKRLYTDLHKKDVPCWMAPHDLRPGTPILRGIEEAIHLQDIFLLILSKYAVNSVWIEREVDAALHQEIKRGQNVLFPIRLDNAVLESNTGWATRLQHRHIGDFTGWQDDGAYNQAFTTLLQHLKVAQAPNR